ncbi:hypothetical protein KXD93_14910 [Mucilaginibacter sp. BJC16-A38]|uniref:hypothetical protein n=1 Tax=Mucilaginibacter phenanthrenivorans TaxID=1234842 RepID=UPI002156FDD7|nr:hypothetical protein [Mucilaginibacter phenanthrenivorans]MCR8558945.1 hypothetical protein [Mucilaginibacter phenanthrenivorans]
MRRYILVISLMLLSLFSFAQNADDAEFQRIMQAYKEKIKHVRTPQEGIALLNEMQAKQKEYLAKKLDTVTKIKNRIGYDQAVTALGALKTKQGNARYENNPLYTKCKVEMTYNYTQDDRSNGDTGYATFKGNGQCSVKLTTYLFKYLGKIVLETPPSAIVNKAVSGSVTSTGHDINTGGSYTYNESASAIDGPVLGISLNYESPTHWSAAAKVIFKGTHTDNLGASLIDTPDVHPSATNDNGKLVMQGNNITITCNYNENTRTGTGKHIQTHSFTGTLTIRISPANDDKYIAYFEPVGGQQVYEQWMPEGYRSTVGPHGNYIDIKIKVESRTQQGQDFTNQITHISWELPTDEVSRVPGYASNAPSESEEKYNSPQAGDPISRLADMQLQLISDQPDTAIENLQATSTVNNNYTIRVYSFDWGGYAKLVAHVTLTDGTVIDAKERTSGSEFLLLPKRDGNSKVATWFKTKYHCLDKNDLADDEKMGGDDSYPGDGFTLYEEYRGFIENKKHINGDPKVKDVMVYNGINTDRSRDAMAMYENALKGAGTVSLVKTHNRFLHSEFGIVETNMEEGAGDLAVEKGVTPIDENKFLNFNYLPELHSVNQHGIALYHASNSRDSQAATKIPRQLGTPKNFYFIYVATNLSPAPGAFAEVRANVDRTGKTTIDPNGSQIIRTDEYAVTIAHEMLHDSHIYHHGDNGEYNGLNRSTFTPADNNFWLVNGTNRVKLFWEGSSHTQILTNDQTFKTMLAVSGNGLIIGTRHGSFSGNEDCIMRYDNALAYCESKTSTEIFVINTSAPYAERTGTHLCTSGDGTGVNNEQGRPNRYGNAAEGRGNCIHQFCINDKYAL